MSFEEKLLSELVEAVAQMGLQVIVILNNFSAQSV